MSAKLGKTVPNELFLWQAHDGSVSNSYFKEPEKAVKSITKKYLAPESYSLIRFVRDDNNTYLANLIHNVLNTNNVKLNKDSEQVFKEILEYELRDKVVDLVCESSYCKKCDRIIHNSLMKNHQC